MLQALSEENLNMDFSSFGDGHLQIQSYSIGSDQEYFAESSLLTTSIDDSLTVWDSAHDICDDLPFEPIGIDSPHSSEDIISQGKEDFQKIVSEWQKHLGLLQATDMEDMDVKDLVGLGMDYSQNFCLPPEGIFEELSQGTDTEVLLDSVLDYKDDQIALLQSSADLLHGLRGIGFMASDLPCKDDYFDPPSDFSITMKDENVFGKTPHKVLDQLSNQSSVLNQNHFKLKSDNIEVNTNQIYPLEPIVHNPRETKEKHNTELERDHASAKVETNIKVEDACSLLPSFYSDAIKENLKDIKVEVSDVELTEELKNVKIDKNCLKINNYIDQQNRDFGLSEAKNISGMVSTCYDKELTTHSRPEEIKIKMEIDLKKEVKVEEEDCVDIETEMEQIPVLEARDLTSLLEQFEASEAFNTNTKLEPKDEITPASSPYRSMTHQNIRDALPKEVIDRIKACSRKKVVPVIPAMPNKRTGRAATRMHDAAVTLGRNKILKIVSSSASGDTVQLDHDYCQVTAEVKNESQAENRIAGDGDKSYSKLPEYYYVLSRPNGDKNKSNRILSLRDDFLWDKSSRRDSGLESGELSDASEEPAVSPQLSIITETSKSAQETKKDSITNLAGTQVSLLCANKLQPSICSVKRELSNRNENFASANKTNCLQDNASLVSLNQSSFKVKDVQLVSVLKCNLATKNNCVIGQSVLLNNQKNDFTSKSEQERPKKKLNLEQYRNRLKDRVQSCESSRASSPISIPASPAAASVSDAQAGVTESTKPKMLSVEVQTIDLPAEKDLEDSQKPVNQTRDRRHRQYRTKRASSSSSSCSSGSVSPCRITTQSHSVRKWRKSKRRRSGSPRVRSVWSRSPSSSSSSSSESGSSSSRSCYYSHNTSRLSSRSRSRSRSRSTDSSSHKRLMYSKSGHQSSWRCNQNKGFPRSRSPYHQNRRKPENDWQLSEKEKLRQVEERRVVYVGRIEEGTSKAELRKRFEQFGAIVDISVHFREHGDNYGFVTFKHKMDAYEAVEHGNDNPKLPRYDLCFGGRRAFCKTRYADLDGLATHDDMPVERNPRMRSQAEDSFDLLLREAQAKLRKRNV